MPPSCSARRSTRCTRAAPLTTVHVDGLTASMWRGASTHFDGVTTVVAKLFSIVGPCAAYFGRKDAQQVAVIARMVDDLNIPVDVVSRALSCANSMGSSMSSRNKYCASSARRRWCSHGRSISRGSAAVAGERGAASVIRIVLDTVAPEPSVELEYMDLREPHDHASRHARRRRATRAWQHAPNYSSDRQRCFRCMCAVVR